MNKVTICKITETDKMSKIMKECDYAFSQSIVDRNNYPIIFEKVSKRADFFAAFLNSDNSCVGYAAVYANDFEKRIAYITLICVKPEMQGLHIGSELIDGCCNLAMERKMKKIRLEVLTDNLKAIEFYKHHGFLIESYTKEESMYMVKILQE